MILLLLSQRKKNYMLNAKIVGIGKAEIFPHFLRLYWWGELCVVTSTTHETFQIAMEKSSAMENFPPTPTMFWKEKAFWLHLCMCFSECGSTITIKAQIMRINVCKKLFIRSMRRRSMMHIFMVLCKSFLISFFASFSETIQRHDSNENFLSTTVKLFSRILSLGLNLPLYKMHKKLFWQRKALERKETRTICDDLTSSQDIGIT